MKKLNFYERGQLLKALARIKVAAYRKRRQEEADSKVYCERGRFGFYGRKTTSSMFRRLG